MNNLHSILKNYPTRKVAKGEVILQQNETPTTAFGIKDGVIRLSNIMLDGTEKIISYKMPDDIFPVDWLFNKTTDTLFYYQAHTDCELYIINKPDFELLLAQNHEFTRSLLSSLVTAYVSSTLQIDALVQARATIKLLYTFRHLALRYGKDIAEDRVKIQIPFTQQELASYMGLTRETTAMEVSGLKKQQVITCHRKYYTVNTQKLNAMIDDDYNPGISINLDI